ncbi:General transcription factor II-I repeat domain-containing protein 2A [Thelohanellus kitauei]|uniref:General transcription factor II-I repeat domain-containing protein 2A n=1 Tax=Thelohanellus kitauei TaxID=669202 RepID=A0A0C2N9Y9_THEKT|nr:General transcription factor II-I repeat domain-containing protein 2A [Thelohanellus kitauei]
MELQRQKIKSITTDGSPSLTGKKVGLLKRMSDHAAKVDSSKELIFLHCIILHEILCQGVLDMKHVVDPIDKSVNFIQARVLNHRQFIRLLEECGSAHNDTLYPTAVCWLCLFKFLRRV